MNINILYLGIYCTRTFTKIVSRPKIFIYSTIISTVHQLRLVLKFHRPGMHALQQEFAEIRKTVNEWQLGHKITDVSINASKINHSDISSPQAITQLDYGLIKMWN